VSNVDTQDLPFNPPLALALREDRPVLGVDPGMRGGIAFVYEQGAVMAYDIPLVGSEVDVEQLVRWFDERQPRLGVLERAQAFPEQGRSSIFRYGCAWGSIRGAIVASKIPLEYVTPGKWKAHFRVGNDKELSRGLAQRLWPGTGLFARVKDHGRAEAALIARYVMETANRGVENGKQRTRGADPDAARGGGS